MKMLIIYSYFAETVGNRGVFANQNQRYEAREGFPGYEGSPCGIPRGVSAPPTEIAILDSIVDSIDQAPHWQDFCRPQ